MTLAIEPTSDFHTPAAEGSRIVPHADELPTIAFVVDGETYALEHVSAFFVDYAGRSVDEVRGDGWRAVVHPEDLSRACAAIRGRVERGEALRVEVRLRDRHGAYRWHDLRATPTRRSDGRIDHWRGVCTDIEDLRRSEREHAARAEVLGALASARGAEELHRTFASAITRELADLCAIDVDEPGRARARRIAISLAPTLEAPSGVGAAVSREDRERLVERSQAGEVRGPEPLFAPLAVRALLVLPLTVGSTVVGHVMLAAIGRVRPFDAADLRVAEALVASLGASLVSAQALEDASRAAHLRDELLAVVSHELRTPLSTVLGWSRLLKENAADATRLRRGLDVIERSAVAQSRIIDDLLDASRAVTGKLRLSPRDVSVGAIAREAAEAIKNVVAEKRIAMSTAIEDDACAAVDADRVRQVLDNLLTNAAKFTPVGGSVSLTARTTEGFVELLVTDSGVGIDPTFLPHVFDRFRQGDSSTTRRQGGLGIGLAIVRAITELHGGSVDAKSDGLGAGSTFTVRLPVGSALPRERPRDGKGDARTRAALAQVHILVVDDEPDARELNSTILASHGAQVVTAGSAKEAMRMLEASRVDLLLSDIGMPDEDGVSLVRRARAQFPTLPAIALSAYARVEDEQRALTAGFARYLTKPVDPDHLVQAIAALARR